jgi:hypothetical protein
MSDTFTRTYPGHVCRPTCRPPVHVTCSFSRCDCPPTFDELHQLASLTGEAIGEPIPIAADECPECWEETGIIWHVAIPVWFVCDVAGAPA